jgi:hypothetical protein
MKYDERMAAIDAAVATFPEIFRLRAFPGVDCRLGHRFSHFFLDDDTMQLVVQVRCPDGEWRDMGRNTPEFIRNEMVTR